MNKKMNHIEKDQESKNVEKAYIVILNYNGWKDTIECLESVLRNDYTNYQIVVIDNNSPNNSMKHIIDWAEGRQEVIYPEGSKLKHLSQPHTKKPIDYIIYNKNEAIGGGDPELENSKKNPLIFIQAGENRGFAAGNNIGIQYALAKNDFEYIWFLNNDTVVEVDTLSKLVKKVEEYKKQDRKIGIIGSKLLFYDNPRLIQGVGGVYNKFFGVSKHFGVFKEDNGRFDNEEVSERIDYIIGASMFVRKDFINDIGLMCENYFLYYEELDWAIRGRKKGWNLGYCWDSKIFHKEGSSIGSKSKGKGKSELSDFWELRNRIIFTKKFFPSYIWSVCLGFLIVIFNRIRRGQFSRLRIIYKVLFNKDIGDSE